MRTIDACLRSNNGVDFAPGRLLAWLSVVGCVAVTQPAAAQSEPVAAPGSTSAGRSAQPPSGPPQTSAPTASSSATADVPPVATGTPAPQPGSGTVAFPAESEIGQPPAQPVEVSPQASTPATADGSPPTPSTSTVGADTPAGESQGVRETVVDKVTDADRAATVTPAGAGTSSSATGETDRQESGPRLLPWDGTNEQVDRYREVPGEYVKRSLTMPEGTFGMAFANYSAFVDTSQSVGWVPVFAFGVTSDFEIAISAPLRYDEGLGDWAGLDPIPELTFHVSDSEELEVGIRTGVIVPVTSDAGASLRLGVPLLWHAASTLRIDAGAEVLWTFTRPVSSGLRVPLAATLQVARWLYAGLGAAPNVGLGGRSKTTLDANALFGLTLEARERAQADLTLRVFAENLGSGDAGKFSDGAGVIVSLAFFPDVY